ncbi:MAG: TetR/AcrR family transcriptional regulator [Frankiaceae bacterium]
MYKERLSRREAAEQTRVELLEAGADLLREEPVGDILSQVKVADVARRAGGRSIGAVYHHWRDQDSYRRDLLAYILQPGRYRGAHEAAALAATVGEEREPGGPRTSLEAAVRTMGNQLFDELKVNPWLVLQMALWSKQVTDPYVRGLLKELYQGIDANFEPVMDAALRGYGLRIKEPFDIHLLAVVLTALAEGLAMRWGVDPDAVPETIVENPETGGKSSLFAEAVLAVLGWVTEPVQQALDDT